MDRIMRLSRREEDALQAAADRFIDQHDGDAVKALKTMMLLNRELQKRLDALQSPAPAQSTPQHRPAQQRQFTF